VRGHRGGWLGIAALSGALTLVACNFAPQMNSDAVSYNEVVEETTDRLLVLNILRSRDKAPLHFAAVPLVHESLQVAAGVQATVPFGATNRSPQRDLLTPTIAVQQAPSFDLSTLDTKDFITGISSPIDPRLVKYALDRGFDRRLILMLFFSSAEVVERKNVEPNRGSDSDAGGAVPKTGHSRGGGPPAADTASPIVNDKIRVYNSPREAIDGRIPIVHSDTPLGCDQRTQFELYLDLINRLQRFTANAYSERRLVAEGFNVKNANDVRDLAQIDPNKFRLVYDTSGGKSGNKGTNPAEGVAEGAGGSRHDRIYRLYAISQEQKVAFCYGDESEGTAVARVTGAPGVSESSKTNRCTQPMVDVSGDEDTTAAVPEKLIEPREAAGEGGGVTSKPLIVPGHEEGSGVAAQPALPEQGPVSPYCAIFDRFKATPTDPRWQLRLGIRSVGEMISFLGDLLYYQGELPLRLYPEQAGHRPRGDENHNNPVTLGFCDQKELRDGEWQPKLGSNCEPYEGGTLIRLDGPSDTARFTVDYVDHRTYSVEPYSTADRTLLVLAILNQLINLNKSASDIKTTPFVQVQP